MFPLKLDCIILPHQIKCLFGIRVSSSKLLHNSSAVGLGDIKALAFLKLKKKKDNCAYIVYNDNLPVWH